MSLSDLSLPSLRDLVEARLPVRVPLRLLIWSLHLLFYALGELLDLVGLLDDIEGENILVGLVDVGLEFDGELEEFVSVILQGRDALFRGLFLHVVRDPRTSFIGIRHRRGINVARCLMLALCR